MGVGYGGASSPQGGVPVFQNLTAQEDAGVGTPLGASSPGLGMCCVLSWAPSPDPINTSSFLGSSLAIWSERRSALSPVSCGWVCCPSS